MWTGVRRVLPLLVVVVGVAVGVVGCRPPAGFAYVCGKTLCLDGEPWNVHAATAYGAYGDADAEVALAQEAGVNTLEAVVFAIDYRNLASQRSEATWVRMDRFVAAAKAGGLKVVMNLSEYGWALNQAGIKGVTHDWGPYLEFVTKRVNTVTGVAYRDEPAIAGWELWGEIPAPNYGDPMRGTTAETTEFYRRTLAQLQPLVPNQIVSTGGFSYLNDAGSGIDWRTIVSLADNDTCDMEINSWDDRNVTTQMFTDFCEGLGKPWRLAAFSSCQGSSHFPSDINHWSTDAEMAAHHRDMYAIAAGAAPATYPGLGSHFWNLRDEPARDDQCSIGHQYPLTLAEVAAAAL